MFHFRRLLPVALSVMLCLGAVNSVALAAHESTDKAAAHTEEAHHSSAHSHDEGHNAFHQPYSIWADLPLWSAIAFIGFVFAIKQLGLWNLLLNNMSLREKAETEAIATAESTLNEARSVLRTSRGRLESLDEQIREAMAEADRDARSTRNDIIAIAEHEAQASVERARLEIDRVRDQSLNDIFETLSERVADQTEQRLRSGLNDEDHHRLIDSMLSDLVIR